MRPKNILPLLICAASLLCLPPTLSAQSLPEARTLFLAMPDSLLPLLSEINRADFIDFIDSQMRAEVTNRIGGRSTMTRLTPSYVHLRLSPQTDWQMKVLALNDTTAVVLTVHTAYGPAADSRLQLYSAQWEPMVAEGLLPPRPTLADFLTLPADSLLTTAQREARQQADMTLTQAIVSPDEPTLSLTLTTPDYMDRQAADTLRPYVVPELKYVWREGRFVAGE